MWGAPSPLPDGVTAPDNLGPMPPTPSSVAAVQIQGRNPVGTHVKVGAGLVKGTLAGGRRIVPVPDRHGRKPHQQSVLGRVRRRWSRMLLYGLDPARRLPGLSKVKRSARGVVAAWAAPI